MAGLVTRAGEASAVLTAYWLLLTAHRLNLLHPNSLLLTTLHPNPIHPDPLHPPLRSGNGVHDAIDDVGNALWEHSNLIYGSFDYYASIIEGGRDAHGEVDIFALTYNAYTAFVHDGRLDGPDACPLSEIDIIWVTVNTPAQRHVEAPQPSPPLNSHRGCPVTTTHLGTYNRPLRRGQRWPVQQLPSLPSFYCCPHSNDACSLHSQWLWA